MAMRSKSPEIFDFDQYKHLVVLSSLERESAKKMLHRLTDSYPNFSRITIINFTREKKLITETNGKSMMIEAGPKQFSFCGNIKADLSAALNSIPCQLLINSDTSSSIYLHAIATLFKNALRLGMYDDIAPSLYDIRLYTKQDIDTETYLKHCKTYLHALCGGDSNSTRKAL
jgi:hypothetical protein